MNSPLANFNPTLRALDGPPFIFFLKIIGISVRPKYEFIIDSAKSSIEPSSMTIISMGFRL